MSEGTAVVSKDTALVSMDTAVVSVDTAVVSVYTALVSVDTALVSVDTSLVSVSTFLVSEDTVFFGRSKRFRAEDHLPVPLESAIQTFLCGGSRPPFGDKVFQGRHSFRLPLSLELALVAMFTGAVGSPLDCKFRGMCLCARPDLSGVYRSQAWSEMCGGSVAQGFHFLVGFSSLSYFCCDVVAIRCCLFCFVDAGPVWKDAFLD